MNIVFENPDKINGLMTITVEEADFKDNVEKTLKDYRKRANVPGFRPGKVPMSLIKRQIGASAKMDAVNKVVGEQLYKYIQDNKIQMLGEPLPSEQQVPVDLEQDGPYTFKFDIAVAPEFKIELTNKDKVNYYTIDVDDKLIDQQVDMYASRSGKYEKVEDFEGNDMLKGDIRELDADGNTKEGGITVESAVLMPEYIKVEEQKNLFKGAKLGDIITFNPKKAYPENLGEISSLFILQFSNFINVYVAMHDRVDCKGGDTFESQLVHDVLPMGDDRGEANVQLLGDLLVDVALHDERHHLYLAVGEDLAVDDVRHGRHVLPMPMSVLLKGQDGTH